MTHDALAELQRLLDAATKGPWRVDQSGIVSAYTDGKPGIVTRGNVAILCGRSIHAEDRANAALIVAAVNALPTLIAELTAANAIVKELEAGRREPSEPGGFVGDIFYGDPLFTTRGTHGWDGTAWSDLPDDTETLMLLLSFARLKIEKLEAAINTVDGEAPASAVPDHPTVGFRPSSDPEVDDGNDTVKEAWQEGRVRGLWEAADTLRKAAQWLADREGRS